MNLSRWVHVLSLSLLGMLLLRAATAHAQSGGDYDLTWYTVDGGGAISTGGATISGGEYAQVGGEYAQTGGEYALGGTAGQPDAGILSGGDFELSGGFWTVKMENPTNEYTLSVNIIGGGCVTRVPSQTTYLYGDVVTLTAAADSGWYFGQWSGAATGILTQTTITLDTNKVVTATFIETPPTYYTLTLSIVGSGIITPAAGTHPYLSGTQVDLSANPAEGWKFDGWSGDLESTSNLAQVTMNTHKTVTATFSLSATTNHTPTADAGPNKNVIWGDVVTLDGSGSSDPDAEDTLAYRWAQTGSDTVTLSDANIESPTFTASTTGTLTFTLTVTDSGGLADSDSVSITVTEKRYQTYLPLLLK